jgi:cell division protein FtsN
VAGRPFYRVRVGPYASREEAQRLAAAGYQVLVLAE